MLKMQIDSLEMGKAADTIDCKNAKNYASISVCSKESLKKGTQGDAAANSGRGLLTPNFTVSFDDKKQDKSIEKAKEKLRDEKKVRKN